jgi:1-acyl-sn-glycerol-3-phosphate acyltransferase
VFLVLLSGFPLGGLSRLMRDPQRIVALLREAGTTGPAILFLLMLGQVFLALIPGHALVMASGYVYGAPVTIAVVATSTILGSQVAFTLARRLGRRFIYKLASPQAIERWNRLAGDRGPLFYFFTFVLPIFPADLMCYVAGLGRISPRKFFVVNVAGRLLASTAMTLIGAFGFRPPLFFWLLSAGCFGLIYAAWRIYDRPSIPVRQQESSARRVWASLSKAYRAVFGVKYDVSGLENLPPGPKILAANHPGATDGVLLPPLFFEEDLVVLAEWHQFHSPISGWLLTRGGHIPVGSGNARDCFRLALQKLAEGKTLLIFAEGTLNPEYAPMRGRTGAVRLALAAGVPLIPIGIHVDGKNTLNLRFHAFGRGHLGCFQFRGKYSVRVGCPWRPAVGAEGVHALTGSLMQQIYRLVKQAQPQAEKGRRLAPAVTERGGEDLAGHCRRWRLES